MIDQNWKDIDIYVANLSLGTDRDVWRYFIFNCLQDEQEIRESIMTKLPNVKAIRSLEKLYDGWIER